MSDKGYSTSYFDNIKKVVIDNLISPYSCAGFFYPVNNIESIENILNINTEFSKSFTGMFAGCEKLIEIDLTGFNTINAVSYLEMFTGCNNLIEIDVSGFSFDKIKSTDLETNNLGLGAGVAGMFSGCSKLKTIYSNKDLIIKDKIDYDKIFDGCNSLIGGNGTPFNYNKVDTSMAVVDSAYQSGYFTYDPSRYRWDGGCYYINGVKQINKWITDNFDMYYVDKNGKPLINKWKDGRYLGNDGKMLRNTKTPDGKFVNYQGDVVDTASDFASIDTNDVKGNAWFRTDNGIWYYFEGDRTTYKRGWFIDPQDEQTYYLDPSTGIMLTGWQEIDGNKYYFNERPSVIPNWYYVPENDSWASYGRKIKSLGSMFKDEETPDGKRVDKEGKLINE